MLEIPEDLPVEFIIKEHEALMNIWFTGNIMQKIADKIFYPKLSTAAQFNLLLLLDGSENGLRQKELCEKMLVHKSNITGLIDRLSKQDLVKRIYQDDDRRSHMIQLTDKGKSLLSEVYETYMKLVKKVMKDFSQQEMKQMIEYHRKIRVGMKNMVDSIKLDVID